MNAIESLEQRLQDRSDEIVTALDAPCDTENGFWFLNALCWGRGVQVEWSRRYGYRIIYRAESRKGLGQVQEEVLLNSEADRVFVRVVVVLCGPHHLRAVRV